MKLFFCPREITEVKTTPMSAEWHGGVLVVAKTKQEALKLAQLYDEIDFRQLTEVNVWDVPSGIKGVIYDDMER